MARRASARRLGPLSLALRATSVALLACAMGCAALPPSRSALAEEASAYSAYEPPALSATSALLVDTTTGTTLMEKEADALRYPASTTKVMTALVVLEHASLDDQVTVESSDFSDLTADSSLAGLLVGETLTVRDLLACLLLPSGNEAAYVLARHVGGDAQAFVQMMNDKASELGCTGTHFANPCGLHADDHYTTARDLTRIFQAALAYPEFVTIAGSHTWDLPATSLQGARTLENTNLLIDPESSVYMGDGVVIAGKTGYTLSAGRCLVVAAQRDGMTLVGVVMGAEGYDAQGVGYHLTDMKSLLEWGFGAWQTGAVVSAGDVVGSADVMLSSDGDEVAAAAAGELVATVPRGTTLESLTAAITWESSAAEEASDGSEVVFDDEELAFHAPLEQGGLLGRAELSLEGRVLGTVQLVAVEAMALSLPSFVMWWLSDPLHAVLAVCVAVAVFVFIGLLASWSSQRRRRRYRMARGGYGVRLDSGRGVGYEPVYRTGHGAGRGAGRHVSGRAGHERRPRR